MLKDEEEGWVDDPTELKNMALKFTLICIRQIKIQREFH